MGILLNVLKVILIRLATKHAAELLVDATIAAMKKGAEATHTDIDDNVVAVIEKEKDFIIKTINGSL